MILNMTKNQVNMNPCFSSINDIMNRSSGDNKSILVDFDIINLTVNLSKDSHTNIFATLINSIIFQNKERYTNDEQ